MLNRDDRIDFKALLILAVLFAATWLLWDTPLMYPIKIFVVMLHELGHALAAPLTGGQVVGIRFSQRKAASPSRVAVGCSSSCRRVIWAAYWQAAFCSISSVADAAGAV